MTFQIITFTPLIFPLRIGLLWLRLHCGTIFAKKAEKWDPATLSHAYRHHHEAQNGQIAEK